MSDPWYISERAESIAILRLTDDPDNVIVSREPNGPYDLVLGLSPLQQHHGWQVVFEVKGLRQQQGAHAQVRLSPQLGKFIEKSVDRPVALLAVDVERPTMFFAWLRAPVLKPRPQLEVKWSNGVLKAERVTPAELKTQLDSARKYFAALPAE